MEGPCHAFLPKQRPGNLRSSLDIAPSRYLFWEGAFLRLPTSARRPASGRLVHAHPGSASPGRAFVKPPNLGNSHAALVCNLPAHPGGALATPPSNGMPTPVPAVSYGRTSLFLPLPGGPQRRLLISEHLRRLLLSLTGAPCWCISRKSFLPRLPPKAHPRRFRPSIACAPRWLISREGPLPSLPPTARLRWFRPSLAYTPNSCVSREGPFPHLRTRERL